MIVIFSSKSTTYEDEKEIRISSLYFSSPLKIKKCVYKRGIR
jgi:hypothetical protein